MNIVYRIFTMTDYDEVLHLWENTTGIGIGASDSKERMNQFLEKNKESSFVAICNNSIIGTVLCGSDGRRGYLYHVFVKSEFRKKGIATNMINRCLAELKKEGIEKCHLFAFSTNTLGLEYYRKNNWTERVDITAFSKNIE